MSTSIKQRVVGAIILIAILAIFIPLFLSSHSDTPTMRSNPPIPPPMPVINLKLPPAVQGVSTPAPVMVAKAMKKQLIITPKTGVAKAVNITSWRLRLGSFSYQIHSKRLVHDLKNKGFEAYSQIKKTKQGQPTYQVYIGPAVSKVEAVQLQNHLLHVLGMPSIIVAYPSSKK
jgi:DedD protein